MGVTGLWSLLNQVKKESRLAECKGKKLAVDLSAWIVQCSSVNTPTAMSKPYLCCRGIFFRTLNLLSLGIMLVFVLDGPAPPAVKKRTKRRDEFYQLALQYKELLIAMGLPVMECDGEAEKMCAELDRQKIVDGVLTNDGDVLIYGAQTVYKGLFTEKKEQLAHKYEMADITSDLGLSQHDLVAFALLSAGDICDGVPTVGPKKFEELMKEFKRNKIQDALDRLKSWKSNSELTVLHGQQDQLKGLIKVKHCSRCAHEGTKQDHIRSGCIPCHSENTCIEMKKSEGVSTDHPLCSCQYHQIEAKIKPYETELKLQALALKSDPNFPKQAVIDEFLMPMTQTLKDLEGHDYSLHIPSFHRVCEILEEKLKFTFAETMSHLVPATIKMAIHGLLPELNPKPLSIVKACRYRYEQCYMVRWQRLDLDEFSDAVSSCYDFPVPSDLFASLHPDMVEKFTNTSYRRALPTHEYKKRKAEQDDPCQTKITDIFKIVKKPSPQEADCTSSD